MNPNTISNLFTNTNSNSSPISGAIPSRNDAIMSVSIETSQTQQSKNRSPGFIWGIHRWENSRMKVTD